jgi:hypothetical protein
MDKVIYCKTLPYKFEKEYRLAIPSDDEGDWTALPYDPQEITELYLGLAMSDADKRDIVALARAVNRNIKIFQASRNAEKKLTFKQL